MTKEQWQILYDELYYIRHQFDKCYYDVFENTDISKTQSSVRKSEMNNFVASAFNKIRYNQEAYKLFEENRNIDDLKHADHFEWNLTPFLQDIKKQIESLH